MPNSLLTSIYLIPIMILLKQKLRVKEVRWPAQDIKLLNIRARVSSQACMSLGPWFYHLIIL